MHSVIATFALALLLVANVDATFQRCQADFYCTGGSLFNSPHNSYGADGNIYQRGQCIELSSGNSFCSVDSWGTDSAGEVVQNILQSSGTLIMTVKNAGNQNFCKFQDHTGSDITPGASATISPITCTLLSAKTTSVVTN